MASAATRVTAATAGRGPRALLLVAALLNLVPAGAYALLTLVVIAPGQYILVAGTGSLAAVLCTVYAVCVATLSRSLRVLLGGVAVLAGVLFIGGDAVVRSMPTESIGPGLIPFAGLLLHLSASVTLFTLALIYQTPIREAAATT